MRSRVAHPWRFAMKTILVRSLFLFAPLALGGLLVASTASADAPASAPPKTETKAAPATAAAPGGPDQAVTFDAEADGAPSAHFEAVIGDWYVGEAGGSRGLWVDGSKWRQGTPS